MTHRHPPATSPRDFRISGTKMGNVSRPKCIMSTLSIMKLMISWNDHFGSNMSEHFDWCHVLEFTDNMEIVHAKQHFDGIQHLVPLIRVIVKKFHHIFLGTYVPGVTFGKSQRFRFRISKIWSTDFGSKIFDSAVPMNHQNPPSFTKESHVSPTHPILSPYFPPKVHSDAHELYIIVHGMTCGSPQLDVQHVAFWWTVLNEAATCSVDLFWLGPGLNWTNHHYYYLLITFKLVWNGTSTM